MTSAEKSESSIVARALLAPWLVSLPLTSYLTGAYIETAYGGGKLLLAAIVTGLLLSIAAAATHFFSIPRPIARQQEVIRKVMVRCALVLYPSLLASFLAVNRLLPPRLEVPHEAPAVTILGAIYVPLAWLAPLTVIFAWFSIKRRARKLGHPTS